MKFIKKYYPMLFSILYCGLLSFIVTISVSGKDFILESNYILSNVLLLLLLLIVIGVWVQIVVFIIHAAKNNNGIWALWIYLFNIFIIPYYNFKYVIKEINSFQIILYVFSIIYSIILGIGLAFILG